jgi:hypothetical protein
VWGDLLQDLAHSKILSLPRGQTKDINGYGCVQRLEL